MYLRKYCNINRCKVLFWTKSFLYEDKNKNLCLDTVDIKQNKDFVNILNKTDVLKLSKLNIHTSQGCCNRNDKEPTKKSDEEISKKPAQEQKATTEEKTSSQPNRPVNFPKTKQEYRYSYQKTTFRVSAILLGLATVYYFTHVVVDPITGRKKFHLFSINQTKKIGKIQSDHYKKKYGGTKIETSGKNYDRVLKILTTLMLKNSDLNEVIGERSWTVFIIDNDAVNSYVLANGDVFVYSGLLLAVDSEDQLAAVLAHQIAHVLLNHSAEIPTWRRLFLAIIYHPLVFVCWILPSSVEALASPVLKSLSVIALKQPMGIKLEEEADKLGVEIMAKACFDPRKAKEIWMNMEGMRKNKIVKLLSTHPHSKSRNHQFDSIMPKAFNILHKHCTGNQHPFFR